MKTGCKLKIGTLILVCTIGIWAINNQVGAHLQSSTKDYLDLIGLTKIAQAEGEGGWREYTFCWPCENPYGQHTYDWDCQESGQPFCVDTQCGYNYCDWAK